MTGPQIRTLCGPECVWLTPRVRLVLWADLVDLRGQEVAKNLTFNIAGPDFFFGMANDTKVPPGTQFSFLKADHEQFSAPVGEAVGFDLYNVDQHPFHIHINPFQLTQDTAPKGFDHDWFQSGDWHDTLLVPGTTHTNSSHQRVLMV